MRSIKRYIDGKKSRGSVLTANANDEHSHPFHMAVSHPHPIPDETNILQRNALEWLLFLPRLAMSRDPLQRSRAGERGEGRIAHSDKHLYLVYVCLVVIQLHVIVNIGLLQLFFIE